MILNKRFSYTPSEHEAEKASNSYLMSLVALVAGLPLPIVNLIATVVFYFSNRKGTYFVRWHCTQALLSQLIVFVFNNICFWWTIALILNKSGVNTIYFVYLSVVIIFNIIEFIATIYTAIETRKGIHIEWWGYNKLTHRLCKP
ncbi:DUF4870 domain-containing protein [Flavobacterium sp. CBA20B-1]|uniref:DUF4870 domain-containing protein n=1 Tax=unclassified Flavobacterium TaxID=196869 RepID=UPI00222529C0|nr:MULTISPECIES: DUF4870 domain-containing protein [unclassified Flavobacterium]WCM43168.1 DUF4870 domain-containing protein [Flavobacterium sp. CBA20B-1]